MINSMIELKNTLKIYDLELTTKKMNKHNIKK